MKKIFSDDPLIAYAQTEVTIFKTKNSIDLKLMEYNAEDIGWRWKPDKNEIFVQFNLTEVVNDLPIKVVVRVNCPIIWDRANKLARTPERRQDRINLQVGLRSMFWYIKSHLETSYAMQGGLIAGFLPDIVTVNGETYFNSMMGKIQQFAALPEAPREVIVPSVEQKQPDRINVTNGYPKEVS